MPRHRLPRLGERVPASRVPTKGRCTEPIQSAVNRTLDVVWRHMPAAPVLQPSTPRLILITVSFPHALQLLKLQHCARVLRDVPNTLWLVAEDAARPTAAVADLLRSTGKPYRHIAHGPTRQGGNAQRNALLQIIKRERLEGIAYNMDDDNAYHPTLWQEMRQLRPMRVGVFGVRRGSYPPPRCDGVFDALIPGSGWKHREQMIERPTYDAVTGRFAGFEAGWCDPGAWNWVKVGPRTFCVDMGGFAFDTALLQHVEEPIWNYTGHGGESELISKLLPGGVAEDLQPLANCGQNILVFHNEYRIAPNPVVRPPMRCSTDGWGVLNETERREAPTRPWPSTWTGTLPLRAKDRGGKGGGGGGRRGGKDKAKGQSRRKRSNRGVGKASPHDA